MPTWAWVILGGVVAVVGLAVAPLLLLMAAAAIHPLLVQPAVRLVLWPRYRLRVVGAEHLPRTGPAILAVNHISWLDGFILAAAVPRHGKVLVYAPYISGPVIGRLAKRSGMIPVPSSGPRAQRAVIEAARTAIDGGEALALFPEAQISRSGVMGPFFRGIEVIRSGREHVPVIPVAIDNLWGSLFSFSGGRFFRKWPRGLRRTVCVAFGPPVEPPVTAFSIRQALVVAAVRAFELRPPKDQARRLGAHDLGLPHWVHPRLGLLAASAPDFERDGIRQVGQKSESVGQAVPGVAIRAVDDDGRPLPADAEGRLEALLAGHPEWETTGLRGRIDAGGFVFLADGGQEPRVIAPGPS